MEKRVKVKMLLVIILVIALALSSLRILAEPDPKGPDKIARGADERKPDADAIVVQAQAGNVTALTINATRITNRWQGYYGNITGTITLDDAQNNSLYQWQLTSPEGEIYAVNSSTTPTWANVFCFNMSPEATQNVSLAELEGSLGMGATDIDGINETFNHTFKGSLVVGSTTITGASGCRLVSLHVNDAYDALRFNETILLSDNTSSASVIYVSLLEQDATGFSGSTLDFQMIVGENGDTTEATNYYFYVELT